MYTTLAGMKYNKPHTLLLYGIGVLVVTISVLLIEFATPVVISAYYAHWLVLGVTLILCVSPFGSIKLVAEAEEKPRHTVWQWLVKLFCLEIALFFVYIGMALVFAHWLPAATDPQPLAIRHALETFLKHDGLFPWAIYALFAGSLGYLSYVKNQDAYIGSLLKPLFNSDPDTVLGISLNLQARSASFIVLAATFAFMTLLIAVIITPRTMPLFTGFHIKTMVIVLAIILIGFTSPFKKLVKVLLTPKIPLFISVSSTLILFALFIWLLNALFGHLGQTPIPIPKLVIWLERKNAQALWMIFSAAWWIGWTPLIAAHIAKLSRGYRVRSVMLAVLILPCLMTLLIIRFPHVTMIFHDYPITFSVCALIGFLYLLAVITKPSALPMMIRSYLPRRDLYKHRDHYFYFRKLFQIMLLIIYLYLPTGMAVTVFLVFVLTLSITLQIPFHLVAALCRFNKER